MIGIPDKKDRILTHHMLGIIPSWHCDMHCTHCFIPDHLRVKDAYNEELMGLVFRSLPPEIVRIPITGGEPFLHPRRLFKLLRMASEAGRTTTVVTNAMWALEWKKGQRLLRKARELGLIGISISVDYYHRPALPVEVVMRTAKHAKDLGLYFEIQGVGRSSIKKIKQIQAEGVFSGRTGGRLFFDLVNTGAATSLRKDLLPRKKANCCISALSPVVLPDGRVMACCTPSLFEADNTVLQLGRLPDDSLAEMLDRASKDLLLAALVAFGPFELVRLLGERRQARRVSQCELCLDILKNEEAVSALRSEIAADKELRKEIVGRIMLIDSCYRPVLTDGV